MDYIECTVQNIYNLIDDIQQTIDQTGLKWWFRGQEDGKSDLLPSVKRYYNRNQERFLTHDFYIKAKTIRQNCPDKNDYSAWLTLMQHYGLPTRLLDWSRSPLIASFFATQRCFENSKKDACVWALCPSKLNLSNMNEEYLYPMDKKSIRPLLEPAFKNIEESTNKIVACWAVEYDMRVFVQQSAFTVHDSDTPLNRVVGSNRWLKKYVIPFEKKREFRKVLKVMGFELSDVFPDLDNLSINLRSSMNPAGSV